MGFLRRRLIKAVLIYALCHNCHKNHIERNIVKLMFCPACFDVFKLVIAQPRSCICGAVRGQLVDHDFARTNNRGVSMVIGNGSLVQSIAKLNKLKQDKDNKFYQRETPVLCWVRPHTGPGNPRTNIEQEDDKPLGSSVKLLYQAVMHYREEHPDVQVLPTWVEDAERMLALIQGK